MSKIINKILTPRAQPHLIFRFQPLLGFDANLNVGMVNSTVLQVV